MNLLLSSRFQLRERYGERDARRVMLAIEELTKARASRGINSQLLLIEEGLAELKIAGGAIDTITIFQQIVAVADALERQGDRLESVLIIGGPEIIPFHQEPNPPLYDGDTTIPTDIRYSLRDAGALMPEWPVGRLPGTTAALLIQLLNHATHLHNRQQPLHIHKTFGYSTAAWQEAATAVYTAISDAPPLLSPPNVATTLDYSLLNGASVVYCNLHGVRDGPVWYGQAEVTGNYLVALRVEDVQRLHFHGTIVMSEACYGAAVEGRDERSSMALAFLARGAACFVGATAMSYGPATSPLSEADLIAEQFLRALRAGGTNIGRAFLEARANMLLGTLERQPTLDEDDRKTALEFVLYGDLTLLVGV